MVILKRGIPATVEDKNLRKPNRISLSDVEKERYALAAQALNISLSEFFRRGGDMMVKISAEYAEKGQGQQ